MQEGFDALFNVIGDARYGQVSDRGQATDWVSDDVSRIRESFPGDFHLVSIDGVSEAAPEVPGAVFKPLKDAREEWDAFLTGGAKFEGGDSDYFYHLNTLRFRDGVFLRIPDGADFSARMFHVLLYASERFKPFQFHPRVVIDAGKGSKVNVALHSGTRLGPYFMNAVVAVHPGREIHVILDNLNTHKPKRDGWRERTRLHVVSDVGVVLKNALTFDPVTVA